MINRAILSEGQLAVLGESMRLASAMEDRIDRCLDALRRCNVTVEDDSIKNIRYYLDKMHQQCAERVGEHVEALLGVEAH